MPLQTGRDLHVDAVLSNILISRRPAGYIADQLVPILPVAKQSNFYYKRNYKESLGWTPNLTARAPGTSAKEVFWSVSSDTYYAKNYALGSYWTAEDLANADDPISLDTETGEFVTDRLLIDFEMRVAQLQNTSTNVFTTTHVATPWSNTTGSRPYDDITDQIELFRQQNTIKPNVAVIPEQVMSKLRKNDQIRDLLFGDRGGVATDQQLASLLGLEKLLVPAAFVNTAGPGETFAGSGNLSAAWPNTMLLAYVSPLPGRKVDTWVQGFRWTNPELGQPWAVRRLPYDNKKKRQDIDVQYYQDEKIISAELCFRVDSLI